MEFCILRVFGGRNDLNGNSRYSSRADRRIAMYRAKVQRGSDGALNDLAGNAFRPVRAGKEAMHHIEARESYASYRVGVVV
jgi:hypothetical protein